MRLDENFVPVDLENGNPFRGASVVHTMKRLMATVTMIALVAGLVGLVVPQAMACSCAQMALEEYVDDYPVIFAGRELGRSDAGDPDESVEVVFEVESVYRGEVTEQYTVYTSASGASCGVSSLQGSGVVGILAWIQDGNEPTIGLCGSVVAPDALTGLLGDPDAPLPLTAPPPIPGGNGPNSGDGGDVIWWLVGTGAAVLAATAFFATRRRPDWVDGYRPNTGAGDPQ